MIELLFIVALMGVLGTMSVIQLGASRASIKGDGAMRIVMSQMRAARELAIGQRRYMRVVLTEPDKIEILREEVPGPTTTLMSTTRLEGGPMLHADGSPDTPDEFGNASAIDFGTATTIKFTPDGTLVNQAGHRPTAPSSWACCPTSTVGARRDGARIDRSYPRLSLGRQKLEAGVTMQASSGKGFSLIEVMFAMGDSDRRRARRRRGAGRRDAESQQLARRRRRHPEGGAGHRGGVRRARLAQADVGADPERRTARTATTASSSTTPQLLSRGS